MEINKEDHILVTGGAGFIGSNFLRKLVELGYSKIISVDALTYAGYSENIPAAVTHRYTGRIEDAAFLNSIGSDIRNQGIKVKAVVNFAAESHVDRSIDDGMVFIKSNVLGVGQLLEFATRHEIQKFIQVGTDEVYGDVVEGASKESDILKPSSPYSASKAAGDLLALSYSRTHNLTVIVSRCSNNYGPFQTPEKYIPRIILKALDNEDIPIYGDGNQVREWIHVTDHVGALIRILETELPTQILNIGNDNLLTNLEVANLVLRLTNSESKIKFVNDRPGHDRRYHLDSKKIANTLSWRAEKDFSSGLQETIQWILNHRETWIGLSKNNISTIESFYGTKSK